MELAVLGLALSIGFALGYVASSAMNRRIVLDLAGLLRLELDRLTKCEARVAELEHERVQKIKMD